MPSDVREVLRQALIDNPPNGLIAAYLFGSRAEGRAHRESDVDIGILLCRKAFPDSRDRFDERVRFTAWAIGMLRINDVDIVVLNDAPPQFGRRIVTEGQCLYCADGDAAHAFLRDTQLRAADVEPFLRRTREIKRHSLASR